MRSRMFAITVSLGLRTTYQKNEKLSCNMLIFVVKDCVLCEVVTEVLHMIYVEKICIYYVLLFIKLWLHSFIHLTMDPLGISCLYSHFPVDGEGGRERVLG
jgi:hypothetical protein